MLPATVMRAYLTSAVMLAGCGRIGFDGMPASSVVVFGDLGDDTARVIAATARVNVLVGGLFRGAVDFGCAGALASAGGSDGFVLELTSELACGRGARAGSPTTMSST